MTATGSITTERALLFCFTAFVLMCDVFHKMCEIVFRELKLVKKLGSNEHMAFCFNNIIQTFCMNSFLSLESDYCTTVHTVEVHMHLLVAVMLYAYLFQCCKT